MYRNKTKYKVIEIKHSMSGLNIISNRDLKRKLEKWKIIPRKSLRIDPTEKEQ